MKYSERFGHADTKIIKIMSILKSIWSDSLVVSSRLVIDHIYRILAGGGTFFYDCQIYGFFLSQICSYIPDKKRNAPLRTVQLSGRSQVIGQFSLYQCKGISGTAASHVFCNLASKLC